MRSSFHPGKRVLITGATSGIGEQIALQFASKGANLLLVARRETELIRVQTACRSILKEKNFSSSICDYFVADITVKKNVVDLLEHCKRVMPNGGLDIFMLNAGISMDFSFDELTLDDVDRVFRPLMETNFFALTYLVKVFTPMLKEYHGQVVAVSSGSGVLGMSRRTGYVASKHALHGFFNALRNEWADDGVTITIVCPGFVNTPIHSNSIASGRAVNNPFDESKSMKPDVCAQKIINATLEKRRVYHIPTSGFVASLLYPFPLLMDVADAVIRRLTKNPPPD